MCEISCVLPFNSKNFLKIIAGKIQINLHKLHFLKFWFWESSNETQRTCFWVIFDLLNYGCCSVAHSCPVLCDPPWTAAHRPFLSFTISWSLLKCMSIEPVMPSNHLILCHPLLLLPSIFPTTRVFSSESALQLRWPKYCSFSLCISPVNGYSGLISFRIDWFNLPAVEGTLKSLLQHQFEGTNFSVYSLFYCPGLTTIHDDYWKKNHSFDYMDLYRQSNVSAF